MENSYERFFLQEKILSLALLFGAFSLWPDLPSWSLLAMALFVSWRILTELLNWKIPSKWMTGTLSVFFLFITLYSFRTLIGKDSATSYLIVLCGLKILEYREESEKRFILLLGIFLVTSKFLFSYDLIYTITGFTSLLVYIYHFFPSKKLLPQFNALPFLFKNLFLALPLTTFLYFFFPRFTQSLLQIQGLQTQYGVSGFSDEIGPGTISRLIQSNELAFRAEILNPKIQRKDLYWRGQVLTLPKGLAWKRDRSGPLEPVTRPISKQLDYKVTLEPHQQNWIFVLEPVGEVYAEIDLLKNSNHQVLASKSIIDKRISYFGALAPTDEIQNNHQVSDFKIQFSPQILGLAQNLKNKSDEPEFYAEKLLEYFKNQEFKYTLTPDDQGQLSLEKFVFENKKGFCEHYASASALMFRAAGYSSRVVIGYQGGTYNKLGRFWNIQQKDAHAWTEYLNSKNRWTRFDATSAVEPLRLEVGASDYLEFKNQILQGLDFDFVKNKFDSINFWDEIFLTLEDWNFRWNTFLLDYNLDKQKEILQSLNLSLESIGLVALIFCLILTFIINLFISKPSELPEHEQIFNLMNQHFKKYDLQSHPFEGPQDWMQRVSTRFPTKELESLFQLYIRMTYRNESPQQSVDKAKKLIRSLDKASKIF